MTTTHATTAVTDYAGSAAAEDHVARFPAMTYREVTGVRVLASAHQAGDYLVVVEYDVAAGAATWERAYTGRALLSSFDPASYTRGSYVGQGKQLAAKLAKTLHDALVDANALHVLKQLAEGRLNAEGLTLVNCAEVKVGDVAYVSAQGRLRRGLVTRTTATKIEVLYTTASGRGRTFRALRAEAYVAATGPRDSRPDALRLP